ncbi:HipA domain-containing protein [Actinocrinis puniceicyclus]|uniref:HipA domain-containing protein n=1 Tax=Actinocrinis puniceicyclus TaxID=977794 RepID=A0A8J7WJ42_9ACTN|nr:HipA domain-containing protein [Actinocrinis puniceicyclus]MBS2963176.1 HipA domain-containing protein [Actinocrinis puniceicyclus]
MWPNSEQWAYAIRRFDRACDTRRTAIHIEDFAQVRDKYPQAKYEGTFDTVAALAYRGRDLPGLREFARRLAFIVMIGNGDAHLKNWSLIYRDPRNPTLSPAYDLVSTIQYHSGDGGQEDLGLRLGRSRRFEAVGLESFATLQRRLEQRFGKIAVSLAEIADDTARRTVEAWPHFQEGLEHNQTLMTGIADWMAQRARSFGL